MGDINRKAVGIDFLTDFLSKKYIQEYIAQGGSKIKFVTGCAGSGKTYLLRFMCDKAQDNNYRPVFFQLKRYGFMISGKFIWKSCGSAG